MAAHSFISDPNRNDVREQQWCEGEQVMPHASCTIHAVAGDKAPSYPFTQYLIVQAAQTSRPIQSRVEAASRNTERLAHQIDRPRPSWRSRPRRVQRVIATPCDLMSRSIFRRATSARKQAKSICSGLTGFVSAPVTRQYDLTDRPHAIAIDNGEIHHFDGDDDSVPIPSLDDLSGDESLTHITVTTQLAIQRVGPERAANAITEQGSARLDDEVHQTIEFRIPNGRRAHPRLQAVLLEQHLVAGDRPPSGGIGRSSDEGAIV